MKLGTDSVICRVVEVNNFISVTHTLKDQNGRRISDVQSVDDLLEALPSLNEPVIEAVPYETDYYNKWARVSRNDMASRASLRPVTVTVKSWTLLHSIPTNPQSNTDMPTSPLRKISNRSSRSPSIASCKSLDSIIDHYNKLFPPESENVETKTIKVDKHRDKSYYKSDRKGQINCEVDIIEPVSNETALLDDIPASDSNCTSCQDAKSTSITLSPKRSVSLEYSLRIDKSSRKHSLQVPLSTGQVCMQWPLELPPPDICHKSMQFPSCVLRRSSGSRSPRFKSPDPFFGDQDTHNNQGQNRGSVTKLEYFKAIQHSVSSLAASQKNFKCNSERSSDLSGHHDYNNTLKLEFVPLRRSSTLSNVSVSIDDVSDCVSTFDDENSKFPQLRTGSSLSTPRSTCNEQSPTHNRRNMNLGVASTSHPFNSPERKLSESRSSHLEPDSGIKRGSEFPIRIKETNRRSHRRSRSRTMKLNQIPRPHVQEEKQKSPRCRRLTKMQTGPPMVEFLDFKDLKVIFEKAANVQKQSCKNTVDISGMVISAGIES